MAFLKRRWDSGRNGWIWHGETFLTLLIVGAGFAFRIRQFIFDRSLWLDEAMVAQNIADRTAIELLTKPLALNQAAPPFFLAWMKIAVLLLGMHDYALRVIPLLCGLSALALAVPLARFVWKSAPARCIFLGLLAVSPALVYYSSECKPYAADVMIAVAVLGATWWAVRDPIRLRGIFFVGLVGLIGEGFSFPSVFLLAAVGIVCFIESIVRKKIGTIMAWMGVGAAWLAGFWLEYVLLLQSYSANHALHRFWKNGFPPPWTSGFSGAAWYLDAGLGLVYQMFLSASISAGRTIQDIADWHAPWNIVLALFILAGIILASVRNKRWAAIFCATMVIVWLAALLQLYPFSTRMELFLAPLVFMAAAFCVDALTVVPHRWGRVAAWTTFSLLIGAGLSLSLFIVWAPSNHSNMKGALEFVAHNAQPGDGVVVGTWANYAFDFYLADYGLEKIPVLMTLQQDQSNPLNIIRWKVCKDKSIQRVWLLYSETTATNRGEVVRQMKDAYPLLKSWDREDAAALLYDVSGIKDCH
jgi:hypothetical protein